jgi:hypothetical protein
MASSNLSGRRPGISRVAKVGHRTDRVIGRSGKTFTIGEKGNYVPTDRIDWYVEERYQKLERLLLDGLSATQLMPHFPGATRSGIIGAARRLKEGGYIEAGFQRRTNAGIPRIGRRKDPTTTRRQQEAQRHDRNQAKTIMQKARAHEQETNKSRHSVVVQDPLTREFVEVETQAWKTHPELEEFNAERLPHAKRLLDCTGCKFPLDNEKPYLFCNATTNKGPYCPTHRAWCMSAVPARQSAPQPFRMSKSKYTS